jgi:hypothetical protein
VTSHQLRNLYRLEKLTRGAKVYGVIADPVRHSISPQVHNRAFQSKRLDAVYLPLLVPAPQLRDFVQFARELPLAGFSVTTPHKQRILRYLDYVEPMARRLGPSIPCGGRRPKVARSEHGRRRRHRTVVAAFEPCQGADSGGRHRRSGP